MTFPAAPERGPAALGARHGQCIRRHGGCARQPDEPGHRRRTLTAWAGSHLFGIGEIVDVLLLAVGAFTIGWSIKDVASSLHTFARPTLRGRSDSDLDNAVRAFAHAVVLAGVMVIMALLLRRSVRRIQATRGATVAEEMTPAKPGLPGLPGVGPDPEAGRIWSRPGVKTNPALPAGVGSTSAFGEVELSGQGSAAQQALVRAHELVHQFLKPRFGFLRTFFIQFVAARPDPTGGPRLAP